MFSRAVDFSFGGSSPSFTTMTFFSQFPHHRSPFFSLNSGEAHAGHASSVRVAPWRSRSAMRLMCWSSGGFRDKL